MFIGLSSGYDSGAIHVALVHERTSVRRRQLQMGANKIDEKKIDEPTFVLFGLLCLLHAPIQQSLLSRSFVNLSVLMCIAHGRISHWRSAMLPIFCNIGCRGLDILPTLCTLQKTWRSWNSELLGLATGQRQMWLSLGARCKPDGPWFAHGLTVKHDPNRKLCGVVGVVGGFVIPQPPAQWRFRLSSQKLGFDVNVAPPWVVQKAIHSNLKTPLALQGPKWHGSWAWSCSAHRKIC